MPQTAEEPIGKCLQVTERQVLKLLGEFNGTVDLLDQLSPERLEEVVVQCCETSRDIRLLIGPPAYVSESLRKSIGDAFWRAVEVIRSLGAADRGKIPDYIDNIEIRAQLFSPKGS